MPIPNKAAGLDALRMQHNDLVTRAEAKIAEVKEGLDPAAVRAIETEHAELVRQAAEVKRQIDALEQEQRNDPAPTNDRHAWSGEDIARIHARAAAFGLESSIAVEMMADARYRSIDAITDALQARAASAQNNGPRQRPQVDVLRDENETRRRGMRDALVARMARATARLRGERDPEIPEHARAFGEMGIVEMAAEATGYRGQLRNARQVEDVLQRAFHTVSDFPAIFIDAMNTRLLARYQQAMPTYRRFCAPYTATDFRPTHVIRAGDFPILQPVAESGEIKAGTFSESREVFKVDPYGVTFNISRQMIVNDNLAAIDQVIGSSGERVTDWENMKAFALLLSGGGQGPTLLTDNTAVFHAANHGNYTSSGTAIGITSLGVGRAAMMKQKSLDGINLGLTPVTIMTGPDRLTEAEQLAVSITPAAVGSAVPDWIKRLVPVGDANITGNAWYLWADPAVAPCFVYGYLEGFEGPRLSTKDHWTVQGLGVKLEHDFGVAAIDFRGGYKNNGAAPGG